MDLQIYCGTDPCREYLTKPFTVGEFTYATNGHIMIRVPKVAGVPKQTKDSDWNGPLKALADTAFSPLAHGPVPEHPLGSCTKCDGRGTAHDCPDCECGCGACNNTGEAFPAISTTIRGHIYALRYIAMMLALPGVEVATETAPAMPLLFKFDGGGVGAIMARRAEHPEHIQIEIEADKAA